MATLTTLFDLQGPVELAAKRILEYNGIGNVFTSLIRGLKDTTPYCSVEAGSFIPNAHVKISGSYYFNDMYDGTMTVVVVTERKNNSSESHSINTSKVANLMMQNDLFNTQSVMPNHYMIRSVIVGSQHSSDEERFLDGTSINFSIRVVIRPDKW